MQDGAQAEPLRLRHRYSLVCQGGVKHQFLGPCRPVHAKRCIIGVAIFGKRGNAFHHRIRQGQAALPSYNPTMLAVHEQLITHRLHDMGTQSIAEQVRRHLMARLKDGEPRREEIAAMLCMTDRTLQRRLQAEQACFQNLLDEVRAELAQKYLADNHHALAQVSDLLGFVDQSNFFCACKRWFGVPPGLFRSQMMGLPISNPESPRQSPLRQP